MNGSLNYILRMCIRMRFVPMLHIVCVEIVSFEWYLHDAVTAFSFSCFATFRSQRKTSEIPDSEVHCILPRGTFKGIGATT